MGVLKGSSWQVGISAGAAFGVIMGLVVGLNDLSVVAGLLGGGVAGLLFGLVMTGVAHRRLQPLSGLGLEDRRLVVLAVETGSPVEDARLAPWVARYVQEMRNQRRRLRWSRLLEGGSPSLRLVGLFAVLSLVGGIVEVLDEKVGSAAFDFVVFLVVVLCRSRLWERDARRREREDRAEQAARRLMGGAFQ